MSSAVLYPPVCRTTHWYLIAEKYLAALRHFEIRVLENLCERVCYRDAAQLVSTERKSGSTECGKNAANLCLYEASSNKADSAKFSK